MKIKTKEDRRTRIKHRIRKRVSGTTERPRLTVFRSLAHMYAQVIDDMQGKTVAAASSTEKSLKKVFAGDVRGGNQKGAEALGQSHDSGRRRGPFHPRATAESPSPQSP